MKRPHNVAVSGRRLAIARLANLEGVQPARHSVAQPLHVQKYPDALLHLQTTRLKGRHAATAGSVPKHILILSSTSSSLAAAADSALPTAFARLIVGAALALSTLYALLASPASSAMAGSAFVPHARSPPSSPAPTSASADPASPAFPSLPVLRTPEQFDAFVLASNRAGFLAIVLFHAPWCAASQRMEKELQRVYGLVANRRVLFARVDCSIKQGIRPGQKLGSASASGFRLQRCDLTQLHRIHKTPTVRMYYNNTCVDEIVGCRPIDFRQATSDLTFKYGL